MARGKKQADAYSLQKIYSHIVYLALLAHVFFAAMFACLHIHPMMLYNILSILFYGIIAQMVKRKKYRIAVLSVHLEVSFFVFLTVICIGWNTGFAFYLIALCALVYFCPYRRIYLPYLFAFMEILLFIGLKVYTMSHFPLISLISSHKIILFIYCCNAVGCTSTILYGAYISNLSSLFTKKELQEENENLQNIVNHDELTHLLTRTYLRNKFKGRLNEDRPVYLIMADVDDFKLINDTYGHPCGDYVLATLSDIMKEVCPLDSDVVRWGGEEFVILLYNKSKEDTLTIIQQLKEAIAVFPFLYHSKALHLTMTYGISSLEDCTDLETLIQKADQRMYYGKRHGKNIIIHSDHNQSSQ